MIPIGLVSMGRSGSTLLMRLMASHPAIVTHDAEPFETLIANHMVRMYYVLKQEADSEHNAKHLGDGRHMGPFPEYKRKGCRHDALENAIEDAVEGPIKYAGRASTNMIYRALARHQGKQATHFIEKTECDYVNVWTWLFGQTRRLVLVRDFRDHAVSLVRFLAKTGNKSLRDLGEDGFRDYLEQSYFPIAEYFTKSVLEYIDDCHIVRYEQLVTDTTTAYKDALAFVGVNANVPTPSDESLGFNDAHATSRSPAESIGRYKQDMPPALIELCNQRLGEQLRAFGYDVPHTHSNTAQPAGPATEADPSEQPAQ